MFMFALFWAVLWYSIYWVSTIKLPIIDSAWLATLLTVLAFLFDWNFVH